MFIRFRRKVYGKLLDKFKITLGVVTGEINKLDKDVNTSTLKDVEQFLKENEVVLVKSGEYELILPKNADMGYGAFNEEGKVMTFVSIGSAKVNGGTNTTYTATGMYTSDIKKPIKKNKWYWNPVSGIDVSRYGGISGTPLFYKDEIVYCTADNAYGDGKHSVFRVNLTTKTREVIETNNKYFWRVLGLIASTGENFLLNSAETLYNVKTKTGVSTGIYKDGRIVYFNKLKKEAIVISENKAYKVSLLGDKKAELLFEGTSKNIEGVTSHKDKLYYKNNGVIYDEENVATSKDLSEHIIWEPCVEYEYYKLYMLDAIESSITLYNKKTDTYHKLPIKQTKLTGGSVFPVIYEGGVWSLGKEGVFRYKI
ncbi:hypothetical protein [Peptostreptococcus faecalis]|uniref:hypothetical protein n=1 Tax=Peptostreptococcus faecalis TaxID=2045015 RepID=UPI000C7C871C|nr:hypothetical protein [Peptostreptococcus faecalis]